MPFDSQFDLVDRSLQAKKFHLFRAQNMMKPYANKNMIDRSYGVGDWVYVKLQRYTQMSLTPHLAKSLFYVF